MPMPPPSTNLTALPGVPHHEAALDRRDFLAKAGGGFGAVAMAYLLAGQPLRAAEVASGRSSPKPSPLLSPLAPKVSHYAAKAKSVIFLFMEGGPSHIDLFDPKPELEPAGGQAAAAELQAGRSRRWARPGSPLLACKRKWKQHGQSGIWVSRLAARTCRPSSTTSP